MAATRKPKIRDEINTYCTKCRHVLPHRIIAGVSDAMMKVECKTCGARGFSAIGTKRSNPRRPPVDVPQPGSLPPPSTPLPFVVLPPRHVPPIDVPQPSKAALPVTPAVLERLTEPTSDPEDLEDRVRSMLKLDYGRPVGEPQPRKLAAGSSAVYERRADVKAWVLREAHGRCELCGCDAPFKRIGGEPYLELHHVKRLAEGGPDTVENAVALCPNCHRSLHHGIDRESQRSRLYDQVSRLVRCDGG